MLNRIMARWLMPALLVIVALSAFSPPADAAWTITKRGDINWRHRGAGAIGFGQPASGFSDTSSVSAAPARLDTTTEWSMLNCDNMTVGAQGTVTEDSLAPAYFILQADSSVASSVAYTTTAIQFQVNYGSSDVGWVSTNGTAYPHNFTNLAKIVHQPIWSRVSGLLDKDAMAEAGGATTGATPGIFAPRMRAIVTWGTAAAVPTCRIFVKKWVTEQAITHQGVSAQ
jgi:hypothetical protein